MNKIKLEAAIFDFDGTLVDSETLYTKSLIATASKMNVLQDIDFESMAGYQTQDMYNILIKTHYVPDNFFDETADYFHKIIETDLETFDGVMETLERLKNINVVIASNSDIDYVRNISNKKDFSKYIKDYSCHNEKLKAKPEPDLFLNAFEILKKLNKNLKKENVLIFEDSLAGVEGAKKTGIKIAAITNSYSKEELLKKGADIILNKINQIFDYIEINN